MSKKQYKIEGKMYDFNNGKFKRLVEKYAKDYKISKRQVYIKMAEFLDLSPDVDAYKRIEKWSMTDSRPNDDGYCADIAKFFNCPTSEFLDESKNEKGENMTKNIVKPERENIKNDEKKFNQIQILEFMKIKDFILNYLYTYYSAYMVDMWEEEKINDELNTDGFDIVLGNATNRIFQNNNKFDVNEYFTENDIKEIKTAIEIQDKYQELSKKAGYKFLFRFNGEFSDQYEEVTIDEQKFLRENQKRMKLLYEYECIKKYGYKIMLRQEVDKTISVLPYEVYNKLVHLIDVIPSPYWQDEYFDTIIDDEISYNINEVIDIDKYEKKIYEKREISEGSFESLSYYADREKEIEDAKQGIGEGEQGKDDEIVYSINNRIMNIHKTFNDIMKKYID